MTRNAMLVVLSKAENPKYSRCHKFDTLRHPPQNDIVTQSQRREVLSMFSNGGSDAKV